MSTEIVSQVTELSFQDLDNSGSFDEVESRDVVDKDNLVGIPFFVTGVTFRESSLSRGGYVSLEVLTVYNERMVINDGSTGIRRQVMAYLVGKGIAFMPGVDSDDKTVVNDHLDNTPLSKISWSNDAEAYVSETGSFTVTVSPVLLKAKHGLRRSDYAARGDKPAGTTFYLA